MKIKLLVIGIIFFFFISLFLGVKMFVNNEFKKQTNKEFYERFKDSAFIAGEYYYLMNSIRKNGCDSALVDSMWNSSEYLKFRFETESNRQDTAILMLK